MRNKLYTGIFIGHTVLNFCANASVPIGETRCSDFSGTGQKEQQLKQDMSNGQHEKSAANTFGQLLGNRVKQVNISTWASGFIAGHAAAEGKVSASMKTEDVTNWLLNYCAAHSDSSMGQAASVLATENSH